MREEKMKTCKYCRDEIPKKAKICPNCKHRVAGLTKPAAVFLLLIVFMLVFMPYLNKAKKQEVASDPTRITKAEYDAIKTDMTYDEVKAVIGGEGKQSSTSSVEDSEIIIYAWLGNGDSGSNATVSFIDGKVSSKFQIGLK